MEQQSHHEHKPEHAKIGFYDKWYKVLLFIPITILILSLVYLFVFYNEHGDFIYKDSSLAGGTTITLSGIDTDLIELSKFLQNDFPDVSVREIKDLSSGRRLAILIDTTAEPEPLKEKVEEFLNVKLDENNSSIEFTGSSLSENFYRQLIIAIAISFVLISIVVFFLFKNVVRSVAILISVFGNIVMPLALVDFLGIRLSAAGIAAFLMLIGYSVDSDILLTTRVLKKREGTINQRIFKAFKTGIFITGTALVAILPAFLIVTGLPESFKQIFLIVGIGLVADILNTWLMNAGILKWYAERNKL